MNEKLSLYAPKTYWNASKEYLERTCNGCGAKGGIKVPSDFFGLSIKKSCDIHDLMFQEGETRADFLFANAMFLLNLTITIINGSNWFSRLPRLWLATKYFIAVALKGEKSYWVNKTKNAEMHITYEGSFK
ncbi:hypothetical protein [Sulfurimonas sp.]